MVGRISDDGFRQAARRLHPTAHVDAHAPVENVDGGAYVEVRVFVCDAAGLIGEGEAAAEAARLDAERSALAARYAPRSQR